MQMNPKRNHNTGIIHTSYNTVVNTQPDPHNGITVTGFVQEARSSKRVG